MFRIAILFNSLKGKELLAHSLLQTLRSDEIGIRHH